jgi:diguanylate cyclase (GGDEF)-like protein
LAVANKLDMLNPSPVLTGPLSVVPGPAPLGADQSEPLPAARAAQRAADDAKTQRRRRAALRILATILASYAVDTVLLGLFAAAGTVPPTVPIAYGATALAVCAATFALLRSRLSLRLRDSNLTAPQMVAAAGLQLACIAYAPQLAFVFLNILFIVFAFAALRLTVRQALATVAAVSIATAAVLYGRWEEVDIPHANGYEGLLVWLCYATTLARCMYAGLYGSALRVKLYERNLELASSSAKIEHLASYDELTGTLNRRLMWGLLEEQLRHAATTRETFCVALLDLDGFKSINDRFGHAVGDAVLQEFAINAAASLRASDRIGRHGGEEFLVLLEAAPVEQATAALERVRQAVERHDWAGIQPGLAVTVSGGLAAFRDGESATDLVSRADAALYDAKRRGRNRLVLAT